jgi:hypothetical protein
MASCDPPCGEDAPGKYSGDKFLLAAVVIALARLPVARRFLRAIGFLSLE